MKSKDEIEDVTLCIFAKFGPRQFNKGLTESIICGTDLIIALSKNIDDKGIREESNDRGPFIKYDRNFLAFYERLLPLTAQ